MNKTRRHFTGEQKAQIVRRHLSGKEPVSGLAEEFDVQPSQIHLWVKQVLDQAERAFERSPGHRKTEQGTDRRRKTSFAAWRTRSLTLAACPRHW